MMKLGESVGLYVALDVGEKFNRITTINLSQVLLCLVE